MADSEMLHPCIHSYHDDDCIGCWEGNFLRLRAENARLRQLLKDAGAEPALRLHDTYWSGGNAPHLLDTGQIGAE